MLHEPEMLFLDEPTAGVDPLSRRTFWNLLYEQAAAGVTILVTTHYMDEAENCQALAFIQRGRLVASGSPQEIKETQMHSQVLEVTCDQPDAAVVALRRLGIFEEVALYGAQLHVITPDAAARQAVVTQTLTAAAVHVLALAVIPPSLEDVFIASVGGARHV